MAAGSSSAAVELEGDGIASSRGGGAGAACRAQHCSYRRFTTLSMFGSYNYSV